MALDGKKKWQPALLPSKDKKAEEQHQYNLLSFRTAPTWQYKFGDKAR